MNNSQAYLQYTEQSLLTATPSDILIMLFNAEIKNIKIAIIKIKEKNIQKSHECLVKAQDIMTELILSLDDSYEIAKELSPLYHFIKNELSLANMKKDVQKLEEILPLVTELRDTWVKASTQNNK